MGYVIRQSEPGLYTVGHSDSGTWEPYADYGDRIEAIAWCAYLNGGPEPRERLTDPVAGALVVGPDDHLVVNIGARATKVQAEAFRANLDERWPELAARVVLVGAESMAVVRSAAAP
jgi:hypothetical protein